MWGRVKHKFGAKQVECDGIKFASKAESAYYRKLKMLVDTGEVVFFTRQMPFHLPGGVKYVVDFTVYYADGTVEFIDVKGMETESFKAKLRMVEAIYPIEITVVKNV